jgi:peptidoglycan/xylan/chitin deacetylase (PgdA/CDA1 family)
MYFCIRDDDTSYFTAPEELERAYGEVTRWGPVSLAVVPFHRAGTSKGVPEKFRARWSVHPLHANKELVAYLRLCVQKGTFEIMLHGYHHDEPSGRPEFSNGDNLDQKILEGRRYLEDLLDTNIRVFVPPHNTISAQALRAIADAGLHLGGVGGMRSGWPLLSYRSWLQWIRLRLRDARGGSSIPWVLDFGDHREIPGQPVTPSASFAMHKANFDAALKLGGVFCVATHYWELGDPSTITDDPTVGEQLRLLIDRALSDGRVMWRSVGDVLRVDPS